MYYPRKGKNIEFKIKRKRVTTHYPKKTKENEIEKKK